MHLEHYRKDAKRLLWAFNTGAPEALARADAGVISLPVVRVGPCEQQIVRRIAEASRGVYQELLEVEE